MKVPRPLPRVLPLLALLSAATPLCAQQAGRAFLGVSYDEAGGAVALLELGRSFDDPEDALRTLATTLGGTRRIDADSSSYLAWGSVRVRVVGAVAPTSGGLGRAGQLDLAPLYPLLRRHGVERLHVRVRAPHLRAFTGFVDPLRWRRGRRGNDPGYEVDMAPPDPISLSYGYHWPDLARFVPVGLLFLAAAWLTAQVRRRHLADADLDPAVAWFRHRLALMRLRAFLWAGWSVACAVGDVTRLVFYPTASFGLWGGTVFAAVLLFGPPVVVDAWCRAQAIAVFARLPEVSGPADVLRRRAWYATLGQAATFVFAALAIELWAQPARGAAVGAVGLALASAVGFGAMASREIASQGVPLVDGPVRARVHDMAEDAAQRLPDVCLLRPVHWRLVNALPRPLTGVQLTPPLLEHLTTREVDALIALEITRFGRLAWKRVLMEFVSLATTVAAAVAFLAMFQGQAVEPLRWWPVLAGPLFVFWALGDNANPRFRRNFDAPSLSRTRDPEALLTALAKLRRLGLLPVTGAERAARGGLPWRRLEALADHAGLPTERLDEIIARPGSGSEFYPMPSADILAPLGSEPREDSRERARLAWANVAVAVAIAFGAAALADGLGAATTTRMTIFVMGIGLLIAARRRMGRFLVDRRLSRTSDGIGGSTRSRLLGWTSSVGWLAAGLFVGWPIHRWESSEPWKGVTFGLTLSLIPLLWTAGTSSVGSPSKDRATG